MPGVGSMQMPRSKETTMKSGVVKRSIVIAGHKTSICLEDQFWSGLKEIGRELKTTLADLVGDIDVRRPHANLSSAVRIFVLDHFRSQIARTTTAVNDAGMEVPQIAQVGRQAQQVNGQIYDQAER
jgi:predicted DNA-binding ribbon-helix-helix protein